MARTPSTTAILEQARTFLGTPYVWGGETPQEGFDCSGFVQWLYGQQGVSIGRTTYDQVNNGTAVERSDLRPGDILFFKPDSRGPGHEGLYLGGGKFIEAHGRATGIIISNLSDRGDYVTARRIIPAGAPSLRTVAGKGKVAGSATPSTTEGASTTVAPSVIPPPAAPPPLPGPSLNPPGSVVYTLDRRQVASSWQMLAQNNPASQPLQQMAYLSGIGLEDE